VKAAGILITPHYSQFVSYSDLSRCVDKPGLLLQSHGSNLTTAQKPFARATTEFDGCPPQDLLSVIRAIKPHVLVGTSTKPKAFTEEVVREMASHVDRPIILPLSNPTRLHEAVPEDLFAWTDGRALVATGSPFPPVTYRNRTYPIAECNNSTCFPGIGLGCILSRTELLTPNMLVAAVTALASQSPALENPDHPLLPDVEDVRDISVHIAKAVVRQAVEEGVAQEKGIPRTERELEEWVRDQMWDPRYRELVKADIRDARGEAKGELRYRGRRTSS
jgi:malate dehydrogenase (oxaloacetate-decarboxylating)